MKALSWYTGVREKLEDPAYAGFFLPFAPKPSNGTSYFSPPCTAGKCSRHYHSQSQTPQHLSLIHI